MHKITVTRLYRGFAEIAFTDIKKAITTHSNLMVTYMGHTMEISWEELASKFAKYDTPPGGLEEWHFKFVPNYHLMDSKYE